VGREAERGVLHERWDALRAPSVGASGASGASGDRLIVIRGEAGIGKSRLADSLVSEAVAGGDDVLSAFCAPDRRASRLYPVVGMLERTFGLTGGDVGTRRMQLEEGCTALGLPVHDTVPFLADVLGLPPGDDDALAVEPRVLRELTFGALTAVVAAHARRGRTLLLVEDLQWADDTTLELVTRLEQLDPGLALLILATARPEFAPDWVRPGRNLLDIGRLQATDHLALVEELAVVHGIPESLWQVIADRTDGNPLFTEELAKSIAQSSGAGSDAAAVTIPRTIRDLLTARLDALGDQKRVAQRAAVIGRDIDTDLLRTVTGLSRRQLAAGLGQLVDAGVVEPIPGATGPVTHRFVHALVRDAAYESQEQGQRRDAHLRVADALTQRLGADPGVVAHHFDAAHVPDKAVEYYVLAATAAQTAAADAEAIRSLDRALELVEQLPEGTARDMSELTVHVVRGRSHVSMQGFSAPGAADDYRRSLELSERVGIGAHVVPATTAIWAYYLVHGDLREAAEAIRRLEENRVPEFEAEIWCCAGVQRFFEGRITEARRCLEESVAAFRAPRAPASQEQSPILPSDSYAVALTHLGTVLWLVGETHAARARLEEAAERARTLPPYPVGVFTEAYVSSYAAWLAILAEEYDEGRALHSHTTELAERYGMFFWLAAGRSGIAIGLGHSGDPLGALAQLDESIGLWQALGAQAFLPFVVTQRALIRMGVDALAEALADVDEAIARADATNEHFFSAESHRVRAAILARLDPAGVDAPRAEVASAKALAAEQGALVFELRAATDLVALSASADPAPVAALRDVVDRFPAGADLVDLDRARSLLAARSAGDGAAASDHGGDEHGGEQGGAGEHVVDPAGEARQ
jgi:tetratricopeptide (TPR) repeat protein